MWRLWTRGWGVWDWWYWWTREGLPVWIVWRLPRRLVYWSYIRMHTECNDSAGAEVIATMQAWELGTCRRTEGGHRG